MSVPSFRFEVAFGNSPGDSSLTYTDVSSRLRRFDYLRGRQYELNQMQAGTGSATLKNLDRAFEPFFSGSPYYPDVVPVVPVRLSCPFTVPADASSGLTMSGNEITDAMRAAALLWGTSQSGGGQADGLTAPAGVFIGRAATNLFRHGQCDATTDWNSLLGGVPSVDATTPASFSPQSIKVVCDGVSGGSGGVNQGVEPRSATGQAAAAGTLGVGSVSIKGIAGASYQARLYWLHTDASVASGALMTFVATGGWQQITPPSIAVATGKTGDALRMQVFINGTRAESFWVAHAMLEKGQSVVAPYVPTSGGVTATKAAARVQAASSLLAAAQGAIALRLRMGYASNATPGTGNPAFFSLSDGTANNRIQFRWNAAGSKWVIDIISGGAGGNNALLAGAFAAGDVVTVIVRWTAAGTCDISINGAPFSHASGGAGTFTAPTALSLFDIGSADNVPTTTGRQCDSDVLWAATFAGTLTDADAARIAAFPNTPTKTNSFYDFDATNLYWGDNANITAFWPAIDDTYRAPTDGALFTGFVERWPQQRTGPTYAEAPVDLVDGFELLTNAVLPADNYPQELSGTRIGRILDAISWSTTARDIDTGASQVPAYGFLATDRILALTHLLDVAENGEAGLFFIANDGTARFIDRRTSLSQASLATFTDQPTVDTNAIGYSDIVTTVDKDLIFNDWIGQRTGGAVQEAIDSNSIGQYFRRSQNKTPLLTSDTEVLQQMQYFLGQYKQPQLRIQSITITPGDSEAAWLQALGREIGDRITVRAHPPGGGDPIIQDALIQQINFQTPDPHPASTKCTWQLLPVSQIGYWFAGYSHVGTDTRAGY